MVGWFQESGGEPRSRFVGENVLNVLRVHAEGAWKDRWDVDVTSLEIWGHWNPERGELQEREGHSRGEGLTRILKTPYLRV
jgi:hypothetical protein